LRELLLSNGINAEEMIGIGPKRNPIFLLFGLVKSRAGGLRGAKVTKVFEMRETKDLSLSYMGWGLKRSG